MKNKGFINLLVLGIVGLMIVAGVYGYSQINNQLGAYNVAGGLTYRLQTSIGSTNTSINLSSFKERAGIPLTMSVLNTSIAYGTLDPQTSNSEFISFSGVTQNADGSAQLTGVTRGLSDIYPFTASSTLRYGHSGQSIFILSNAPQVYNEYAAKKSDESITGTWTFASTSMPQLDAYLAPTLSTQLATKGYADSLIIAGGTNATESVQGISQLATALQTASSTSLGSTGASLVIQSKNATSTYNQYTSPLKVVVTQNDGKIDSNFIRQSDNFTFSGTNSFSGQNTLASTTMTATTTFNTGLIIPNSTYGIKFGDGSVLASAPVSGASPAGVQNMSYSFAVDTGDINNASISISPAISAYQQGQVFMFKSSFTNLATSTLNVNSLGGIPISRTSGSNLSAGNIATSSMVMVAYNSTGIAGGYELVDHYPEVNGSASNTLYSGSADGTKVAQSFTTLNDGISHKIVLAKFYMKKIGSPTGNGVAKLYSHSGVYGTSSVPDTLLATSNNLDVSTLTNSYATINLDFSGVQQVSMTANTYYVISFEYSSGDSSDYVQITSDATHHTHSGNFSNYVSSWLATATQDLLFYVYDNVSARFDMLSQTAN